MRKLLYIDSSFTLAQIRARGLDHVLAIRHLDGYFSRVWSVHPVDLDPVTETGTGTYGPPLTEKVAEGQIFIRGRPGRFRVLARLRPVNMLVALFSLVITLVRTVRKEQIDVIRVGDPLLCGLIGLLTARLTGVPLIVRINGDHDMVRRDTGEPIMPRLFRQKWIEERVEQIVLGRASLIMAPSQKYIDFGIGKGADPDRCHLVRYGNLIDPRHLTPPENRAVPDISEISAALSRRPWLLYIGRMITLKHAQDCFDVLEILARRGSDAGLICIGDGDLLEPLQARAEQVGLVDRVLFLGNRDQDFLSRVIPHVQVVLSPLTGRALTEAAFGAAPIVAYDIDWQGELIRDGETGILVPPRDTQAMADGAQSLLEDRNYAHTLGQVARQRAFKMLDPEKETNREIEVHRLLEARL